MSIPPQLIRVKRKRVDESPVTFLQFDQDSKRHRSGSNWAYQRREVAGQQPPRESKSTQPIIHVSAPDKVASPDKRKDEAHIPAKPAQPSETTPRPLEPRRFHVSKSMLAKRAAQGPDSGVSKKTRYGPALFVESTRKRRVPRRSLAASQLPMQLENELHRAEQNSGSDIERRQLKRPGVTNKSRDTASQNVIPTRAPLPDSLMNRHNEDMDKIANDMNAWVLNELGANLHSMEQDNRPLRFKPKSPAKRFHERHPELALPQSSGTSTDTTVSDLSDEGDDDDWVIEEYVRIPANSVALDAGPADVGILVLEDEEESLLFFGSALDEDDELGEDDEDENAENYYTADYPEDEVDSDDEYGRDAYLYRHGNNSDEEEYDNAYYEEQDEMILEGGIDDDDDARMARIKEFMKRNSAFP
ncbi:hypothetical protein H634G_07361 [Metarhizium anisopliae BRIP 53293]|uniref:Transcription factor Iwr1 domain-containing protein n=1 Tax=Metarhizium anisopliae BRIP 53293 TaxID=1291518 RepID=A0A0D9NUC6_METAN|nr:hypothetical protein H634G_07361 [Metarhizium anisopliae BRIP 53293]KJK89341.1 hypothetical protein H633G_06788 [Metarhizium anisopliae BRIP 53284]